VIKLLSVYVCVGSACYLKSSYNIITRLQQLIEEYGLGDRVVVKAALCLGNCMGAVSARIGEDGEVVSLSMETVQGFFEEKVLERLNKQLNP
jgi:NADH:ubiquinone oxidoreductase subunit E